MSEPIDICLVSWKREDYTVKVVEYLVDRTRLGFRLILVINEYNRFESMEMLDRIGLYARSKGTDPVENRWVVLANRGNEGLEKARNQALSYVKSEIFVDVDNDILCPDLEPCWLTQLLGLMEEHPDYAAIALRTHVFVADGNFFHGHAEPVVERGHVGGSLRAARTKAVLEVGGWTGRPGRGSEERDISGKLRRAGWKVGYANYLICYHMFGKNWGYGGMDPKDHGHAERLAPHIHKYDRDLDLRTFQAKGR